MIDPIEQLRAHHKEMASRPIRLPDKKGIEKATAWISKPTSVISKAFLPGLVAHAGESPTALELTNIILESYNKAIQTLEPRDANILLVVLDAYPQNLIEDKQVNHYVRGNIAWTVDRMIQKSRTR
jgi:hypothetical protein